MELLRRAVGPVTADDHEPREAHLLVAAACEVEPLFRVHPLRARGADERAAAVQHTADAAKLHRLAGAIEQTLVALVDGHGLPAFDDRHPYDRPNSGVHTRRISAARQHADPGLLSHRSLPL